MSDVLRVVVVVPGLKVQSELNRREHWAAVHKRKCLQQVLVRHSLGMLGRECRERLRAAPAVTVRFTRVGGRKMDTDNLVSSFKHIRDAVAGWLEKGDQPGSGVEWLMPPGQEPGEAGVRIELSTGEGVP